MKKVLAGVAGGLMMCCLVSDIQAAEAENEFVAVRSDTVGVERIVTIDSDFHITTTNVPDSFCAEVYVSSLAPWILKSPPYFSMPVGSQQPWRVSCPPEDKATGEIILFKVDVEIDSVGEDKEMTEGAIANYVACSSGQYTAECISEFKPVRIRCLPANRPDGEMIILSFPSGHLLEKTGDTYQAAQSSYQANEIGSKSFWLHGHDISYTDRDCAITATHNINGCHDEATYTIVDEACSVKVVAETSVTTQKPLTECMEGRLVTFTATATGFIASESQQLEFTFHYERADGTHWSEQEFSSCLTADNTAKADYVPNGDVDHCFITPIYVQVSDSYSHEATSPQISVKVYELWIKTFKGDGEPWKVVVGDLITYEAYASDDCKNWEWDMKDGIPRQWHPVNGNLKSGWGMMIPNTDLPTDDKWDHFGKKYGTVDVYCEDEEGNPHHFYSTSIPQKAMVFFNGPDKTHPGEGSGYSKNWFYYWKYALFGAVQNVIYSPESSYGSFDGYTPVTPLGIVTIGDRTNLDYESPYNNETATEIEDATRPTVDGKMKIDLFYALLTHELKHRETAPYDVQWSLLHDEDEDRLPDIYDPFPEKMNGGNYLDVASLEQGDWEYLARQVEGVIAPKEKDWSKGGKQW